MPSPRLLLAAASLTLTACAAEVPWPPQAGSCIESFKRPGRRVLPRYWIAGVPATREEVEHVVYEVPANRERAHRDDVRVRVGLTLLGTGAATELSGFFGYGASGRTALLGLAGAGVVTAIAGIVVMMTRGEPFKEGIVAFNAEARRRGYCVDPTHPFPPPRVEPRPDLSPRAAPPDGLPDLPTRGWTP